MANQQATSTANRNAAATNAFFQDRNLRLGLDQTITGINNQELQYNNVIRQQEVANRNSVFANIAGQIQGNLQNRGSIASNAFNTSTNLQLGRAGVEGAGLASFGQTASNIGGVVASGAFDGLFGNNRGGTGGSTSTYSPPINFTPPQLPQTQVNYQVPGLAPVNPAYNGFFGPPIYGIGAYRT